MPGRKISSLIRPLKKRRRFNFCRASGEQERSERGQGTSSRRGHWGLPNLSRLQIAYRVLRKWKEESGLDSPYIFPSPQTPGWPIGSVKTTWKATLRRAGVPHFPIYDLRHAFCTRLSWVAPDAIIQRAMRHTSPETKRRYQLGMVEQVREAMEKTNQQVYGKHVTVQ
jgi:integrase